MPSLAEQVAAAGWPRLLRAAGDYREATPPGPPTLCDALPLGGGRALAVVADGAGGHHVVPLVATAAPARRATAGDGVGEGLLALLARGDLIDGGFRIRRWHGTAVAGERAVAVDQTNESVIVGDAAVVKWVSDVSDAPHPAPSLLDQLEAAGFTGMPRPWAVVEWLPAADAAPRLLAIVTEYLAGAVDGWTWAVADLRAAAADRSRIVDAGTAVGRLVAEFHRALAATARPAAAAEVAEWHAGALADLQQALEVTRSTGLAGGAAHDLLVRHGDAVRAAFAAIPDADTSVLRVHGDLHVGQVLRTGDAASYDYRLTDFDGNPVVAPAERIREQPAALDVAGMAQSFTHAGIVTRTRNPDLDAAVVTAAAAARRTAFLDAYRAGLGDAADLFDERLLRPFALRQVCREFSYAATHLPRWSYVPEAALPTALEES